MPLANEDETLCKSATTISDIDGQLIAAAAARHNELSLEKLYQAAKDENELLEFKNYELLFKIQELELNQKRMLRAICNNVVPESMSNNGQQQVTSDSIKIIPSTVMTPMVS